MGQTEFKTDHPNTVKLWSKELEVNTRVKQYFQKFMGKGNNAMIKVREDLVKDAGDVITMGLRNELEHDGSEGDNKIKGTSAEEKLVFFNDRVQIDQKRKSTLSKGKMSDKRVTYDIRAEGRDALVDWNARWLDEQIFIYLSGARGIDPTFISPLDFKGRAGNPVQPPDPDHHIFGKMATGKADITAGDTMTREMAERLIAIAETSNPIVHPFNDGGEDKRILLMHNFQSFNLRKDHSDGDWADIRKNTDGKDSKIYKNSMGELAGLILHKHRNVIRFNDYGASGDITAARALLLGKLAGMLAYGGSYSKKHRFKWNEEWDDRGNSLVMTSSTIVGVKKSRYKNSEGVDQGDYGLIAVDTAYTDPLSMQ